jgi:hypothetical protein
MLGLSTCPLVFIALGAPLQLVAVEGRVLMIAMATFGSGFLLWRFLAKPSERRDRRWLLAVEALCWTALAYFVYIVSQFNLMTESERVGATCIFFLGMSLLWLPIPILRATALGQRIARLPPAASLGALIVLLTAAGIGVYVRIAMPSPFL